MMYGRKIDFQNEVRPTGLNSRSRMQNYPREEDTDSVGSESEIKVRQILAKLQNQPEEHVSMGFLRFDQNHERVVQENKM